MASLTTPYMFPQTDVPCTLLCYVNDELRDVAKGTIVQPLQRTFHSRPMSDSVHRVKISRVLRVWDDLERAIQPQERMKKSRLSSEVASAYFCNGQRA